MAKEAADLVTDWDRVLSRAVAVASRAHAGQSDRFGAPYVLHPLRLMGRARTPVHQVVAVLHDVVEDSAMTLDDLLRAGFPPEVVAAVDALTRREGEPYTEAIQRAAADPIARAVKLLDLEDNMDLRRIPELSASDLERLVRYHRAWRRLQ